MCEGRVSVAQAVSCHQGAKTNGIRNKNAGRVAHCVSPAAIEPSSQELRHQQSRADAAARLQGGCLAGGLAAVHSLGGI